MTLFKNPLINIIFIIFMSAVFNRCFIIAGFISILLVPVSMILLLSDPNYVIETILLLASVQWGSVIVLFLFM
ncbi:hypothetical protein SAMN05421832_1157 [Psychrobacillus psychrodurans]|nr:hypothetical protein SAMN05421832_1157 [Psychrobacillus psychrodurans]